MQKVIWQNRDLDVEAFRKVLVEEYPDMYNGNVDNLTDGEVAQLMYDHNQDWLADEKTILNIDMGSEIVCIADIGRWDGRHGGYKMIKSGNIKDCLQLSDSCDEGIFYVDTLDGELYCTEYHHDGVNMLRFRALKEGVDYCQREELLDALYYESSEREKLIRKYTQPLGPVVAAVYGWEIEAKTA